ncbi:MAG: GNAT family N-acetyltransferase [Lachnospiraceae bacterium]|nr:GNAT family N-acetyltransferase [Lachnospiraceae bacterium]
MVWLKKATEDDRKFNLEVTEEQKHFCASYQRILDYILAEPNENRYGGYIIYDDETPVGIMSYCDLDELQVYNFCYLLIDRRYQRRGYAFKAIGLLMEKFREDGKYSTVSVTLFDTNEEARKLYEKCGFRPTGCTFEDEYDMEMAL